MEQMRSSSGCVGVLVEACLQVSVYFITVKPHKLKARGAYFEGFRIQLKSLWGLPQKPSELHDSVI